MAAAEVTVNIPDEAWEDGEFDSDAPAGHRLVATLVINGTHHYLEAYLVVPDADPQRTFAGEEAIGVIHGAVNAEGPWQTTTIRGREYVLVTTPFC